MELFFPQKKFPKKKIWSYSSLENHITVLRKFGRNLNLQKFWLHIYSINTLIFFACVRAKGPGGTVLLLSLLHEDKINTSVEKMHISVLSASSHNWCSNFTCRAYFFFSLFPQRRVDLLNKRRKYNPSVRKTRNKLNLLKN